MHINVYIQIYKSVDERPRNKDAINFFFFFFATNFCLEGQWQCLWWPVTERMNSFDVTKKIFFPGHFRS